jgi:mannose-6-phosphate isomerase-like protein (cupin superfamily)
MKRFIFVVLTSLFMVPLAAADHADQHHDIIQPENLVWQEALSLPAGAKMAVLLGDPTQEGPLVIRLSFPGDYKVPAHTHPVNEMVTVLSGSAFFGVGDTLNIKQAESVKAGSFIFMPADMSHFVYVSDPTIIELHAKGPWAINYVNPLDDPRLQ